MQDDLDKQLKAFDQKYPGRVPSEKQLAEEEANDQSKASATRIAYEMLGAILFFGGVGYLIDKQFNTTPAFTLGLFFLGFAAGMYNAWRALNGYDGRVGLRKK